MLASPADVMFFLDSDVIVIRNLRELMETVAAGKIVVFEDGLATRTYPEWSTILGTPPIRQRTYVNFGHFGIPYRWFTKLIPMLRDIAERIDTRETFVGFGKHEHPLYFADQDVFNALLASLVPASAVVTLPFDYAPHWPFGGVSIVDARSLACRSRGGLQPFLLHNILNKPWLVPTRRTVYSDLLARLLSGDDLAVRIPSRLVPIRFRYSRLSRADQWRADASSWLRVHIGKPGVRTYVQRRRAFRASR
jgi:hypothetical protein